ncbi:MAG: DMT family transporter, partial [Alphaproteobacteria bacterium]|nr:DMT family transporter [Alphaproteobacteria bacterium]
GITLELLAVAFFMFSDMLVTVMSRYHSYPIGELLVFRAVFGLLPLATYAYFKYGLAVFKTKKVGLHGLRSLFGAVTTFGIFLSYKHMNFTDAIGLSFTAVLFITILAVPVLGEKVGIQRWTAVFIGFMGVLVIVPPGPELLSQPWVLVMLACSATYAAAGLTLRLLGATESPFTTVIYFQGVLGLLGGISCLFAWRTPEDWREWLILAGIGLTGTAGQILVTFAYRAAPAVVIAPFDYTYMIWAAIYGLFVFDQPLALTTVVGSSIIAGSGLFILWRETRLHRFRALPLK